MTEILDSCAVLGNGLISAEALRASGMTTHTVHQLVLRGQLAQVRRGWYVLRPKWSNARPEERYKFFVRATAAQAKSELVLSHHSAAVMHGLPLIGPWPATVHTLLPDAAGGSSHRLLTSHRTLAEPQPVLIDGATVTSLIRTVVDMVAGSSFLIGVTMVDHVLHQEEVRLRREQRTGLSETIPITKDVLLAELHAVHPRMGRRAGERAIAFANGLSANAGESLSRVRFEELGFEVPELQVRFVVQGRTYYVDYFWRGVRKIGEFDGGIKYTRAEVMAGRDVVGVVVAEKNREDALRPQADSFTRWGWDLAYNARAFAQFLTDQNVPRARGRRAG
jgi:hypothetical protein